jgi:hypothetical protein
MGMSSKAQNRASPEQRVGRLVARLRHHALWDSLLIFSPPLLVTLCFVAYGYRAGWIAPITLLWLSAAIVGVGLFAVVARYRALIPSIGSAARLVDERTDAKDRFLTLATIEVSPQPLSLVARLRGEAAALLERIDFRREFPYRIKRSFCWSLSGSLLAAALFYLSMPVAESGLRQAPPYEQLRELADKMAERPGLSGLAHELQTLATKLHQASVPEPEKRTRIHQALEQVENQRKKEKEKENRDLLGEALSALQGLEEQSGRRQKESAQGGGIESAPADEEPGKGQQSQGNDGANKGERSAEQSNDLQKGKSARSDLKEQGKEKSSQADGEGRGEQPDPNKSDKGAGAEVAGKTRGGPQEKLGRSRSEEPSRDAPPAERFYKPGEQGQQGVKGAGYVTVQLPEELAVEGKGKETIGNPAKETKTFSKAPLSNAPLPAHMPDAPAEKQPLPLEYRGIIR